MLHAAQDVVHQVPQQSPLLIELIDLGGAGAGPEFKDVEPRHTCLVLAHCPAFLSCLAIL